MFEILEHTADIGIRVWGNSLAELFVEAAMALQAVALEPDQVEPRETYALEATGEDREALLVNWLNEIVWCLDGRRVALARIEIQELSDERLTAQAYGEVRDPVRHPPRLVVKAATWHQLELVEKAGHWRADVYLDI